MTPHDHDPMSSLESDQSWREQGKEGSRRKVFGNKMVTGEVLELFQDKLVEYDEAYLGGRNTLYVSNWLYKFSKRNLPSVGYDGEEGGFGKKRERPNTQVELKPFIPTSECLQFYLDKRVLCCGSVLLLLALLFWLPYNPRIRENTTKLEFFLAGMTFYSMSYFSSAKSIEYPLLLVHQ